jgi:hypothetical protein
MFCGPGCRDDIDSVIDSIWAQPVNAVNPAAASHTLLDRVCIELSSSVGKRSAPILAASTGDVNDLRERSARQERNCPT